MKLQIPSSKLQRSTKHQAHNLTPAILGAWSLKFLWSLELGIWSFVNVRAGPEDGGPICRLPNHFNFAAGIQNRRELEHIPLDAERDVLFQIRVGEQAPPVA